MCVMSESGDTATSDDDGEAMHPCDSVKMCGERGDQEQEGWNRIAQHGIA